MLKHVNFVETVVSNLKLGLRDGTLYTEHTGITFVDISEILMKFFMHRNEIQQT